MNRTSSFGGISRLVLDLFRVLSIDTNEMIGHRKGQALQFHSGEVVDLGAGHVTLNALVGNADR